MGIGIARPHVLAAFLALTSVHGDGAWRNVRWLVRGIGSELLTNVAGKGGHEWRRSHRLDEHPYGEGMIAVVTGATGGIGAEVAAGLASRGYHVIIAARDRRRGAALASTLRASGGLATFFEYDAERPQSALGLASSLRGQPCALLVNNAGVMSVSKSQILRTNLIAPAVLSLALLPALSRASAPRLVNVGSSSHLRAARVEASTAANDAHDADLSAYAESKLGLMQLSTLMRSALPWLEVVDAHPGIVWTPMLQRHWGPLAPFLERTRLSRLLFKSPPCGATTILTAALAPRLPPRHWGERSRWVRGWRSQPYFVNGRPGGYASVQSRDVSAAAEMWATIIEPIASRWVPAGCKEVQQGMAQTQP